jgi:hypothetical protein
MEVLLIVILFIAAAVALITTLTVDLTVADLKIENMTPAEVQGYLQERRASQLTFEHGPLNAALMCPHCRKKGPIRTKCVERKRGDSPPGGMSLVASEVSREEQITQAYCGNCERTWAN